MGSIKKKLGDDMTEKFQNFKAHISDLESAIDMNSKLIKDLTESI
jgi:hypothetical protein